MKRTIVRKNKSEVEYKITSSQKRLIDRAAKKIVQNYGKTLKLLANE